LTANSLVRYAGGLVRHPGIVTGSLRHRLGLRALRTFRRKPIVLFERHGGIGDILCTFPSVLALRERHPDAVFVYSVWNCFKSIVQMGQVADYVVEKDWSKDIPKVVIHDYDFCYQPWLEDEKPRGRRHVHLVDDFAQTFGVTLKSRQPKLHLPENLARSLAERVAPFRRRTKYVFGIHVGPSWLVREWTTAGWTSLVERLRRTFDCTVIQFGSDVDTTKGPIKAPRIAQTEDWVGKLNLDQSVAALAQLDLFIGIDSGLLHSAGAVGTPTVGLFGPIDPALRLPPETPSIAVTSRVPCLGCHHRLPRLHWQDGCPHHIQCMADLSVDDVVLACERLIRVPSPQP
jgi:ADP-heptose:LPS heptosyltransferase